MEGYDIGNKEVKVMKRIFFIMLLLPFVSCGQANQEFKLLNSFPVNLKIPVCVTKNDCFCFSSDSNMFYLVMHYSDAKCENQKLVDSVEFSPYKSTVHSFKSQKCNSYVVLWETEYEYIPTILAYYITEERFAKIGELEISLPCQSCESLEYPIKDIQILHKKEEIEISFLKDINYKEKDSDEWIFFKAGTLRYSFNPVSDEFKKSVIRQ